MKVDPAVFYAFMSAGKAALNATDFYLDLLFGYSIQNGTRHERWAAKSYDRSAQLVDVLGRGAFSILYNHQVKTDCGLVKTFLVFFVGTVQTSRSLQSSKTLGHTVYLILLLERK